MSAVYYSNVYTYGAPKQVNCIDCQQAFQHDDRVIACAKTHIFHERCWPGVCPTTICKKEASEHFWEPINTVIAGVVVFGTFIGLMALMAYMENRR